MLLLAVLKRCTLCACRDTLARPCAHKRRDHTATSKCMSDCFPGMFWFPLTGRGILLGKLHLSKSPAVMLTNEPWTSEVCVCVSLQNHARISLNLHSSIFSWNISMQIMRMTCRWLVYMRCLLSAQQLACLCLIVISQKMDQGNEATVSLSPFCSQKLSKRHCGEYEHASANPAKKNWPQGLH